MTKLNEYKVYIYIYGLFSLYWYKIKCLTWISKITICMYTPWRIQFQHIAMRSVWSCVLWFRRFWAPHLPGCPCLCPAAGWRHRPLPPTSARLLGSGLPPHGRGNSSSPSARLLPHGLERQNRLWETHRSCTTPKWPSGLSAMSLSDTGQSNNVRAYRKQDTLYDNVS